MAEFPVHTPPPGRVHRKSVELTGHEPVWLWTRYRGGLYRMDHYRRCSYCGCIHPSDMMALLRAGKSSLNYCGTKFKRMFATPNPMAGKPCRMGSEPGPVFSGHHPPLSLLQRLVETVGEDELTPTMAERLTGHFERPSFHVGPELIEQPFYLDHTTDEQWDEIIAAMAFGERKKQHGA